MTLKNKLKVNFLLAGEHFLQNSRKVEDVLVLLGRCTNLGGGFGVAQFVLETEHSVEEVKGRIDDLHLEGQVQVNRLDEETFDA